MLNQFIVVGRLLELIDNEDKKSIKILVKKIDKEYSVELSCPVGIFNNIKEYCKVNYLLGIRGCIEENNTLIIEKASFLSSSRKEG